MKAGTTSLCNYLSQHPEIYISPKKEPNFFLYNEGEVIDENKGIINSLDRYQHFFSRRSPWKVTTEKLIGEASVSYLCDKYAHKRIYEYIPSVKLIAILRNPIQRAHSHYLFHRRINKECAQDFSEALILDRKRSKPFGYFERGLYYFYLKEFFKTFSENQIRIYLFDEFTKRPKSTVLDILNFLEVDEYFDIDVRTKDAVSGIPRYQSLYNFIYKPNPIKRRLSSLLKTFLPESERRFLWTKAIELSLKKTPLKEEDKSLLLAKYKDDILLLQDLIKRDLSHWLI